MSRKWPRCARCGHQLAHGACTNPRCGLDADGAPLRCRCGRLATIRRHCIGCGLSFGRCPCSSLKRRRQITATPRQRGTNPRAQATNPRARQNSPRQLRNQFLGTAAMNAGRELRRDNIPMGLLALHLLARQILEYRHGADPDCWACTGRGWIWNPPPIPGQRRPCPCRRDAEAA